MRYTAFGLGLILSVAVASGACSRAADEREQQQQAALATRGASSGEEVTITGCLTGAADGGAFAVTADRNALTSGAIYSGSGEVPTYTYELVGNAGDLSSHLGRQVQVKGRVDEARNDEVDVETKAKAEGAPVQSGNDKVTPAVETNEEMEIKVRRLHVSSVTPTGGTCSLATNPQ
jgi:hypothetical protein